MLFFLAVHHVQQFNKPDSGALWEIMFVLRILYVEDNKNVVHLELFRKVEWSEKQFYLKKNYLNISFPKPDNETDLHCIQHL